MHSSTAVGAEKNLSFRGRASQPEEAGGGGGVDQDTTAGTTSRPRPDAMANMVFSPHNVELPGFDEIVSGGQIKSAWDPDLPIDLDPPTSSCSSNTSGNPSALAPTVLPEELTRLVSFPDLAKSPLQQAERLDGVVIKALQARTDGYNHQSQKYPGYHPIVTRVKEIEEAKTDIPSTSNNFVSFTDPYPKAILSSNETFFDPSPSSAGTSPTIPAQSETSANSASDLAWKMSPELYIPIDSKLSLMLPTSAGADAAMTNWRPRSAPKTSHSRSPSPFLFWNRKGNQPQQEQGAKEVSEDCRAPETPENADATHVDSVSNHLGKMTPPSGWMEAGSLTGEGDEGDGQPTTPPSITREEYEALPLAIQRKYFSAVERLQFEQESSEVDRIYNHYDLKSHNPKIQRHRPALSSPETLLSPTPLHNQHHSSVTAEYDSSWVLNSPERVNKTELTREQQVLLCKQLRASVILDAANEAVRKTRRTNDRSLSPTPDIDHSTATLSSRRGSSDSMASGVVQHDNNGKDPVRESLYDSFRWLDEEDDLDLGLFMDDYHANLREEVPQTSKTRRPSFRRRISISKLPFGRSSMSANRPESRDTSPSQSPKQTRPPVTTQRRLSRTLSVMNPGKNTYSESSTPTVDTPAAHYRDPEARQKLRVFLASSSKFDEAIQYGFPTKDSQGPPMSHLRYHSRIKSAGDPVNMRSFLDFDGDEDDEDASDKDDASSVSDPDSPKTPQMGGLTPPPGHHRPTRVSTDPPSQSGGTRETPAAAAAPWEPTTSDSYMPNPTSSREMTLRMTLTRPDLRANDELIYGWQPQAAYINPSQRAQTNPVKTEVPTPANGQTTTACWSEGQASKDSVEHILAGLDHWNVDGAAGDRGVMKRIWSKVRRA